MKRLLQQGGRLVAAAALLFLLAGSVAPLIDASRWSGPVRRSLQQMLGRQVSFERMHLTLLSGPGVSLENVTISDDPGYGLEPFAFVPTLQVRLRPDRLLFGEIRLSTLRLVEPSLNFVKQNDGTWNIIEFMRHIGTPRRAPFNLFPVLTVDSARIDFKVDGRKSILYVLDSDFSVYPEKSGKLYFQFSGSPARTDRAVNGFGHLQGRINWFPNRSADGEQVQADLTLEPSNLSEIATLLQGHDAGVHGNVGTHLLARGPLHHLTVNASLQLGDLHRWDLLPGSTSFLNHDWNIQFMGEADLLAQSLVLHAGSSAAPPLTLDVRLAQFLARPEWTLTASWQSLPASALMPMAQRMGLPLPSPLTVTGDTAGTVSLTNTNGLTGAVALKNVSASLPDAEPLHAEQLHVLIRQDHLHLEPAEFHTGEESVQVTGDFSWMIPQYSVTLASTHLGISNAKAALTQWFGELDALAPFQAGFATGQINYLRAATADPVWSGRFQFDNAAIRLPGLARPLRQAEGRVVLNGERVDITRFTAVADPLTIRGSYHRNPEALHPEQLRLEMPKAELNDLQALVMPTLEAQGWLARLRVVRRRIPDWLAERDLEGDLLVNQFLVNATPLGRVDAHFTWRGPGLQFSSLQVRMPNAQLRAHGAVRLDASVAQYDFQAAVHGFNWRGGTVNAAGAFTTAGVGPDLWRNLQASGTFDGRDVALSPENILPSVAGAFVFSSTNGWPDLRIPNLRTGEGENAWTGEATSQSDGTLIVDLEHSGQQRHIVSSLSADAAPPAGTAVEP